MPDFTGSTPIIWDERIFLNVADGTEIFLWCVDRNDGKPVWKKHHSLVQGRENRRAGLG